MESQMTTLQSKTLQAMEQAQVAQEKLRAMRDVDPTPRSTPPPPTALDSVKAEIEEMGVVILRLREKLVPILRPEQTSDAVEKAPVSTAIFELAQNVRQNRLALDRLIECIDL